jgi:YD repeat-containing protein
MKTDANRQFRSVHNGQLLTSPIWTNITISATGQSNVSGNVFLPKTAESFTYDADGNLTADGRWTYGWDGENRLTNMTSLTTAPTPSKLKLDFLYDSKGRRIQKLVWTNNASVYGALYTNRFVYDGWNLVAILAPNSLPINSFTWGSELSGSQQGAGGVGGLLGSIATVKGSVPHKRILV